MRAYQTYQRATLRGLPAYAFGIIALVLAFWARWVMAPVLPPGFPFLTFIPAVLLTAYLGGRGPGTFVAIGSGLLAWYMFIPPEGSVKLDAATAWAMAFFAVIAVAIVGAQDALQRMAEQLAGEGKARARLMAQQQTLFHELQHRVANNLSIVSGLLAISHHHIQTDPDRAFDILDSAQARIAMMGKIHRHLYDPDRSGIPLQQQLESLTAMVIAATGAEHVTVTVDADPVPLPLEAVTSLSMLVAELMTNSVKHGLVGQADGRIDIRVREASGATLELTVADNGIGFVEPRGGSAAKGLGRMICDGLAQRLGGTLQTDTRPGGGTRVRLVFSAPPEQA